MTGSLVCSDSHRHLFSLVIGPEILNDTSREIRE
jgi:hypothetical protein